MFMMIVVVADTGHEDRSDGRDRDWMEKGKKTIPFAGGSSQIKSFAWP